MPYDPDRHHRRSVRLPNYDYSQPGAYFVTICTQGKHPLFGNVKDGQMRLNEVRVMVQKWWAEMRKKFPNTARDEYIVMPNHLHGIVVITDEEGAHAGAPLPEVLQWFKTMSTNEYMRGVKRDRWPAFLKRLWQRGYYEHVIRDEEELAGIREYIRYNPSNWPEDPDNPLNEGLS